MENKIGTILDDRYEIKRIIKKSGDTIVYEGWHQQIEEKFLIQELPKDSQNTEKILERARRLSDFSELSDLFQVCDQFSAGEKTYIILEYPKGQCLNEVLISGKTVSEKTLDVMFRTLLKSLEKLEEAGIRDLPVNTETLYLQDDGSLYLFPETDKFMPDYTDYTYQICEVMYLGISGQKPVDKAVRLLFDEMTPLAERNLSGDVEFYKIIDSGLRIITEDEDTVAGSSLDILGKELEQWREKENRKGKKRRYWIAGGVLSAVLICAALFAVYKKYEEKILFWGIRTETILLEPGEDMNRKDYQKSLKTIKNRVKKLVNGNRYLVKDDNGVIRVMMPLKVYQESYKEDMLKEYLSRPWKLSVAVGNKFMSLYDVKEMQFYTLENEEIVKIKEEDAKDKQSWYDEEPVNKMLKITVTDSVAEELKEKADSLLKEIREEATADADGCYPVVCLDGDQNSGLESGDENENWHVIEIPESEYFRLAKDTWKEETFDTTLEVTEEIQDIHWEKKTTTILKNWVGESEISDPSVILEYDRKLWWTSNVKSDEGDYYHNIGDLAQRLETLGISYAIGNVGGDYDKLIVKVRQKDMSDMAANMLGQKTSVTIRDIWGKELYVLNENISTEKENDITKWKLTFEGDEETVDPFIESIQETDGYVYLCSPMKDYLGRTKTTEIQKAENQEEDSFYKTYEISFSETNLGSTGSFTKDMNPLADLFNNMAVSHNMNSSFDLAKVCYYENGNLAAEKSESRTVWEQSDKALKEIQKAGQQEEKNVEFREKAGLFNWDDKRLCVILHMDTSEDYVDGAVESAKKIWNGCDLEECEYQYVDFFIGEYDQEPVINVHRDSTEKKWIWSVYFADQLKAKLYEEIKEKNFAGNIMTEEELNKTFEEQTEEKKNQ